MTRIKASKFTIRLTLYYSVIFIVSSIVMVTIVYFFLRHELNGHHSQEIRHRLLEYWAQYEAGGIGLVEREFGFEKKYQKTYQMLLRIADKGNRTLFLGASDQIVAFDITPLLTVPSPDTGIPILLSSSRYPYDIDVRTIEMEPGIFLQVGLSTEFVMKIVSVIRQGFFFLLIPFICFGIAGGYFIASRLLSPIKKLIRTVSSIKRTADISKRIRETGSGDELDTLIKLFNGMLDRIGSLINAMHVTLDNVAHDLKTPLTRIRGIAERAAGDSGDAGKKDEALLMCIEQSDIVLKMLNTIMDISESEAGVMALKKSDVAVRYMIDQLLELYGYVAEEKGIDISTDVEQHLTISADPDRLRQAVGNLIDNAVKYTGPGGHVAVYAFEENGSVVIRITDTGAGIPQDELEHIWKRLYRIDRSGTDTGLGLGLSIVKAVVTAHGGTVDVASTPGRGSVFTIVLPISA
ncbi:MAG: HAMP domain-containing histidine kinase [Spirochaetales bacterium]|nr:HAMP domain-containing histidine kinase [Spirochaetales bacterium]